MSSDEMLSWLRSTIKADLAQAKAADEAAPGPWVNRGQAGEGEAWQIHGAITDDSETEWDEQKQDGCQCARIFGRVEHGPGLTE